MADPSESPDDPWFVYVLESLARKVTYVGIAKDPEARPGSAAAVADRLKASQAASS